MKLLVRLLFGVLLGVFFCASAQAGFPTVQARSTAIVNGAQLVVTLPAGSSEGELIVIMLQARGNTTTWTQTAGTAGWTELYDSNGQAAYYKEIGAAEANPSFTASASSRAGASALRITGHDSPSVRPPQTSAVATGSDAFPNSPSLTPTGGAKDYLWIATDGNKTNNRTVNAAPANYSNLNSFYTGGGVASVSGATAERLLNAASENPGSFTLSGASTWAALTIVIHPRPTRRIFTVE